MMSATFYSWRRARETNSTATSFTAKTPTATKPSGAGVLDLFTMTPPFGLGSRGPKFCELQPFGTDAADETFDLRLWAWTPTSNIANTGLWIPRLLVELNVTLGDIAATAIAASHFLADTIAIAAGDANAPVISPANDTPASILVHLRGAELLEFDFDLTGAAAANCLLRVFDQN